MTDRADPLSPPRPATAGWFDAHVVTGAHPEHPGPASDPEAVRHHVNRYGLCGALISSMAGWLHDPISANAETTRTVASLSDVGARSCWTAVPPTPGELDSLPGLVAAAVAADVAAFTLFPHTHGYSAIDPVMGPLFPALASAGLPLWLDRPQLSWSDIDALTGRFGDLTVVVSGIGYRELRALAAILDRRPNLHLDVVNFSAHQAVEWAVKQFGAERLLFGTGLGLRDPGESVARMLWSGLDDETLARIGAANAQRVLRPSAQHRASS